MSIASLHFIGIAAAWHQALVKADVGRGFIRNWQIYKILIKERFAEVLDDLFAELKELKETDGIAEYHARFELIRARITMPEEYLLSAYLAGLRLDTQMQYECFSTQSTRQFLVLGYEKGHPRKLITNTWSNSRATQVQNNAKGILFCGKERVKADSTKKMGSRKKEISS